MAEMIAAFALLALFIAAIGLFGVLSYVVAQGTHEIGIRLAVGSRLNEIPRLVLGKGILLVIIGAAIGSAASLSLPKLVEARLRRGGI